MLLQFFLVNLNFNINHRWHLDHLLFKNFILLFRGVAKGKLLMAHVSWVSYMSMMWYWRELLMALILLHQSSIFKGVARVVRRRIHEISKFLLLLFSRFSYLYVTKLS